MTTILVSLCYAVPVVVLSSIAINMHRFTKGGATRSSASTPFESLVRVHDTRSRGETIESVELRE